MVEQIREKFEALLVPLSQNSPAGFILLRVVAANNDLFIANVLVWDVGIDPASRYFLKLMTIKRVRQPDIVAKNECIFPQLRLPQHCVKPFAPFRGEPLDFVLLLLLPGHFKHPNSVVDEDRAQARHLLTHGLLAVQLVDGVPARGQLKQL